MEQTVAVELRNISKRFGSVQANHNVDLKVYKGEILAILGENGSGKTTLMNMIAGIYYPDSGHIFVKGQEVIIRSPKDAFDYHIGMVHQHFKLVDVFTAADNVILGEKEPSYDIKQEYKKIVNNKINALNEAKENISDTNKLRKISFNIRARETIKVCALPFVKLCKHLKFNHLTKKRAVKIQNIVDKYGFDVDISKKIYDMSVSEKQTIEIIKVLYKNADLLILDEPTAVLTPQEIQKLFDVLRKMKADGKSIIIITHKLNEVMQISDRVAVLRKGEHIATVKTSETSEKELTEMMVGKKVELNIDRAEPHDMQDRLVVENLCVKNIEGLNVLDDVSFAARSGEILGIAGIAGSGQKELLEAIAGLQKITNGEIFYFDPYNDRQKISLISKTPTQIRDLGVRLSFVPEDRLGMGLVGNMDLTDNMMLRSYGKGKSPILDRKTPHALAESVVNELEVVTPSVKTEVRKLSGGNVQKVLVGREIASAPTVFMAAYPVRGLDINSSYTIYNLLNDQKEKGVAVIFVGEDLDVLIGLCDRIMVICNGKISGIVDARKTDKNELGLLMTNVAPPSSSIDNQATEKGESNESKR